METSADGEEKKNLCEKVFVIPTFLAFKSYFWKSTHSEWFEMVKISLVISFRNNCDANQDNF